MTLNNTKGRQYDKMMVSVMCLLQIGLLYLLLKLMSYQNGEGHAIVNSHISSFVAFLHDR